MPKRVLVLLGIVLVVVIARVMFGSGDSPPDPNFMHYGEPLNKKELVSESKRKAREASVGKDDMTPRGTSGVADILD